MLDRARALDAFAVARVAELGAADGADSAADGLRAA